MGTVTELVGSLAQSPKVVWSMVSAGKVTDSVISEAAAAMSPGDIIIDGGNSKYTDSVRHYNELKEKNIRFMDAGTSGGIWGLTEGYCLMVGGDEDTFKAVRRHCCFRLRRKTVCCTQVPPAPGTTSKWFIMVWNMR